MGRLPGDTKALALALLNLADDEGYFLADAAYVRGFAEPFTDDSRKTHGRLRELQNAGWIETCEHPTHGLIGRVVNFQLHQAINRPNKSKLKTYFDSLNTHGGLTEGSRNVPCGNREQGTGNREQGKEQGGEDCGFAAAALKAEKILQEWNEFASRVGFHQSLGRGPVLKTLQKKVKEPGWEEAFRGCFPYLEGTAFYRGENDRGWKAGLDWLLRPGKVEELTGRKPDKPKNGHTPDHRRAADEALLKQLQDMGMT